MANDSPYGLAAYLHTTDRRIERFVRELTTGTVQVNGMGRISPAAPFGGTKQSGFGREGGRAGIEEFVQTKTIHTDSERSLGVRCPPAVNSSDLPIWRIRLAASK